MLFSLVNLFPLILTLTTAFGVFVNDSQFNRAATRAFVAPVDSINLSSGDDPLKLNDQHPHAEVMTMSSRSTLQSTELTIQPRSIDRKYVLARSQAAAGIPLWPSV